MDCTGNGNCRPKVSRSSIRNGCGGAGVLFAEFYVAASVISVTCLRISLVASFILSSTTLFTKFVISEIATSAGGAVWGRFRTEKVLSQENSKIEALQVAHLLAD